MESSETSPKRPIKKTSKKIKQSKPVIEDDTSGDLLIVDDAVPQPSTSKNKLPVPKPNTSVNSNSKKRKKRDSASSDEERWLTAIESGKLEDVDDELKKIKPKDPALMTARQRAMYDRGAEGGPSVTTPTLMSLPTGYKEKVMTAEAIQKAAIKSQKRKQLADEKREKDKKKTMERLLKKQESKATKLVKKIAKTSVPIIIYRDNVLEKTLTLPVGMEFPLGEQKPRPLPQPKFCAICGHKKNYSCSKTGVPLCSLECYKKNLKDRAE